MGTSVSLHSSFRPGGFTALFLCAFWCEPEAGWLSQWEASPATEGLVHFRRARVELEEDQDLFSFGASPAFPLLGGPSVDWLKDGCLGPS